MNRERDNHDERGDDRTKKKKKIVFDKDLADIMYAFGDAPNPNQQSVELLEEYILNYLEGILIKAYERAIRRDPDATKVTKEDILYYMQDNSKSLVRNLEFMRFQKETLNEKKMVGN